MSQRYFLTTESAYEALRLELDEDLGYPTSAATSIFTPALEAPRDSLRRIVLAVDDALPHYTSIIAKVEPLLASASAQELTEAEYLAFLVCVSEGGGNATFSTVTDTLTYTNFLTTVGGGTLADALSGIDGALSGKAAASHTHGGGEITFTFGAGSYTAEDDGPIAEFLWSIGDGDSGGAGAFLEPYLANTYAALSHAHSVTADITAGNWKVLYSNGSGAIAELALGASGTVLTSNGTANAPTFQAVQGESFHPFLLAGM